MSSRIGPTKESAEWGAVGESDQTIGAIQRLVFDLPGITATQVVDRLSRRYQSVQVLYTLKRLTEGPSAIFSRHDDDRLYIKVGTDKDNNKTRAKRRGNAA